MNGTRKDYNAQLGVIEQCLEEDRELYDAGQLDRATNCRNTLEVDVTMTERRILKDPGEAAKKSAPNLTRVMNALDALNDKLSGTIGGAQ